ncbi:MAG: hypothetical protein EGQ17_04765 [Lachnospiraceae bacterium]|nr:hypothetical protein [Lachnospiraceae bacterium]MBD9157584.1 hypothetical protein [Lachnospiraceae bacterium]
MESLLHKNYYMIRAFRSCVSGIEGLLIRGECERITENTPGAKAFGVFSCEQGDRTMIYSKQSMVSSVAIVIGTLM